MTASVVWYGFQELGNVYPKFVRAPNDVVMVVDDSTSDFTPPTRVIRVSEQSIPRYLEVVAADAQGNLFLFLDGYLKRFDTTTQLLTEFAYTAPDYYFDFEFAPSTDGKLFGACSLFFSIVDRDGTVLRNCKFGSCNLDDFDVATGEYEPFWSSPLSMPSSIDTFGETFVLGGTPVNRLYKYTFDGKLLFTRDELSFSQETFNFDKEILTVVRFDAKGNIWASTVDRLYVLTNQGDVIRYWSWGELTFLGEPINGWFGIGREGHLFVYGLPIDGKLPLGVVEVDL